MQRDEYRGYLQRAETARSVKELRRIADDVKQAHPDDDDAELIDQTCFTFATALIERMAERRHTSLSGVTIAHTTLDFPQLRAL